VDRDKDLAAEAGAKEVAEGVMTIMATRVNHASLGGSLFKNFSSGYRLANYEKELKN